MGLLIEKDKQRYETAKLTAEKIRIKYHDLKHEMSQRQLDEEEMKEFKETETNYQSLMYSGSKALDLLLMEKVSLAEKRGCHIKSVVDGSLLSFMPSYQIYSLFGNILDNAINAASEMKEEEEKIISLSISLLRSNIVITCSNYTKEAPIIVGGLPKTRHKDKENHGYGMKSIRNTADRQVQILLAEAEAKAATIRAEGDAEYMRLLSEVYDTQDEADFYTFMIALDALRSSMTGEEKTLILDADSPIAQLFY